MYLRVDKKKIEILNKRINDLSTMKYASIGYMDLNISQHVDKLKEVNEKKLKQTQDLYKETIVNCPKSKDSKIRI